MPQDGLPRRLCIGQPARMPEVFAPVLGRAAGDVLLARLGRCPCPNPTPGPAGAVGGAET